MYDGIEWGQILAITAVMLVVFGFLYRQYFRLAVGKPYIATNKGNEWFGLGLVLIISLVIHIIMAYSYHGFVMDMNLFKKWGGQVCDQGLFSVYNSESFIDYPPGYLGVLGILEWIVRGLGLETTFTDTQGVVSLIYKLPACLCDLAGGYYIYKIARERLPKNISLLLVVAYLFNPCVLINSAVWGQVDGIYALSVIMMLYYITKKKLPVAYFVCIVGVLIKPQMMFFAPILIWAIVEQVFLEDFSWKKFFINLYSGLAAIICALLFMVPFGLGRVIGQYTETLTSYPYATVNAFNLWGVLGRNWQPQEETFLGIPATTWGTLFLVASVLFVIVLCYQMRKEKSKYFFAGACIITMIFTFSVRMHERYMFPALALILIAYCMKPIKQLFFAYVGLSLVHFLNVGFVYMINPNNEGYTSETQPEIVIVSALTVAACVYLIYVAIKWYWQGKEIQEQQLEVQLSKDAAISREKKKLFDGIRPSKVLSKITVLDLCIMIIVTAIYSAVAIYNLGAMEGETPNTEYYSEWYSDGTQTIYPSITLDLGEHPGVSKIAYYLGNYHDRNYTVEVADSLDGPWTQKDPLTMEKVFAWGENTISSDSRYLRLTSTNNAISIFELVVFNGNNEFITPLNANEYPELFDENQTYDVKKVENSTYFDEVYHARTAYEYMHGRYSYENTHPPLGKCFIALGMTIFGVCPFGWRIMGVLFGIAMLPAIYVFAKKMMKETWIATSVTLVFAFDFMHFVQTRIATIDVFVTFFIILMYYFMFKYASMSFYDNKLWKTWIPLGLSGLFMGFGVASKWTGAYAGIGLAVIFFFTLFRRYKEYVYAKKSGPGETNGISHEVVIERFWKYTLLTVGVCFVFFILIPAVIYLLSYIPFNDDSGNGMFKQMIDNQVTMFNYHSDLISTHPYSCKWYNWPTMYRPVWYYSYHQSDTISAGISAFGNPLVWWVGVPAAIYMIYLVWKKRDNKAMFLLASYAAQYLPWVFIGRTTYMYHYFPSVPFVVMMIGYGIYNLVKGNSKKRMVAYFYVAAVIGLFMFFYPVLSGYPIEKQWVFDNLRWFDTWVLVT